MKRFFFFLVTGGILSSIFANSQGILELDPYQITVDHDLSSDSPSSLTTIAKSDWSLEDIVSSAVSSVDEILYENPSFSFYRRQDAAFANPSTQGVSLRNIGATAAGRTMVLLDGVPINDAFGGWLYWSQIAPLMIESIDLLPSYVAGSWGNMGAGGVVSIRSRKGSDYTGITAKVGEASTSGATLALDRSSPSFEYGLSFNHLSSDGHDVIHPEDRGTIDTSADRRLDSIRLSGKLSIIDGWEVALSYDHFNEERGNGTPLARNDTISNDWSIRLDNIAHEDFGQSFLFYLQDREFVNTFTSVSSDRTSENPVNQQYSIPSSAGGIKWSGFKFFDSGWRVMTGIDFRSVDGETNENVGWGLKTKRKAGGSQQMFGAFATTDRSGWEKQRIGFSARLDRWSIRNGKRTETDNRSGEILQESLYRDRDNTEFSYSAYWEYQVRQALAIKASFTESFRIPTINELYRPFRVRNDITESNPELIPEKFQNIDLALEWEITPAFAVNASLFHYTIKDAIANVYAFDGPANSLGGFVPAGGTFNQKQNVENATVNGVQLFAVAEFAEKVHTSIHYLYSESKFGDSKLFPDVSNKRFPQVPEHKFIASLRVEVHSYVELEAVWNRSSAQFDDALNRRELGSYDRLDLFARWRLDPNVSIVLRIKNATDAIILTGQSSSGIRSIAPGRFSSLSLNWNF